MPIYSNATPPYSVGEGWGQEIISISDGSGTLGLGNFSQRVAIQSVGGSQQRPVAVTFVYTTPPASVQYDIYVAVKDSSGTALYTKVGSTTNVNGDQVTLNMAAAAGNFFRFLCVKEVISPGVTTVVAVYQ